MNIGIYLHTKTGRTAAVARRIAAEFTKLGDNVETNLLRTEGTVKPRSTAFEIKPVPAVDKYDLIIFGGPVWAFQASPVISKFLDSLRKSGTIAGKKTACLVTKGLPFGWTGGSQALGSMRAILTGAGATVLTTLMVSAFRIRNEKELGRIAEAFAGTCRS
jgi:flavodoxin